MKIKIIAIINIFLIIFSGLNSLFAFNPHTCITEMPKEQIHCPMTMQKMSCCPAEKQNSSCHCPEMSRGDSLPVETLPFVFTFNSSENMVKYLTLTISFLSVPDTELDDYKYSESITSLFHSNKIYKAIQSYLI